MKKTGIAIAVVLATAAASTGGAWYTGTQLENVLNESIERGNEQIAKQLPGSGVKVELASLERGLFTSQARYRLHLGEFASDLPGSELVIVDQIEHGPFPLSRLKSLQLLPVMAYSTSRLEQNELVAPLFKLAGEQDPILVSSAIGYDRSASGEYRVAPLTVSEEGVDLSFSGLNGEFDTTEDASELKLSGHADSLVMNFNGAQNGSLKLSGMHLESDRSQGAAGLYLGDGSFRLDSLEVSGDELKPVRLSNMVQTDSMQQDGDKLSGQLSYEIGEVSYDGQVLGSSRMDWSLSDFDGAAMKSLTDLYNAYALRMQASGASEVLEPSVEEQAQLLVAVQALLAGKPKIALDNFSIKTANGESRFSLKLALDKPQSLELPPEQLVQQLISRLDARLELAKPMISDIVGYKTLFEPQADPQQVAMEAKMMAEMAGEMANAMQLGKLEGDTIVSSLSYADGNIDFNGQVMPAEQFAAMLAMMSPAGMGAAPAPEQPSLGEEGEPAEGGAATLQ